MAWYGNENDEETVWDLERTILARVRKSINNAGEAMKSRENAPSTRLRFAPFIRVSTERQEKQGESLQVQKTSAKRSVENLGGVIPEYCLNKYYGQEHATSHHEKKMLDTLLSDASKGIFDAVIVTDASRWSRDNSKSKEGLHILRENNIRFFIGTTECDLYSEEQILFLGMSAEIGEFQARIQARKSILSKIERAKQGKLSSGKPPYGRYYDKKENEWKLMPEKQEKIKFAISCYLSGGSLNETANIAGVCRSQVHYIFTKCLGSRFGINFDVKRLQIKESIKMEIPPLVDDETIRKVHEKLQSNKTFGRNGFIKNRYLLNRMIFCQSCGYALTGATYHDKRYYRHGTRGCQHFGSIPADLIENKVMDDLFDLLGDTVRMKEAAQNAMPDLEKKRENLTGLKILNDFLKKLALQKNRIINAIAHGIITEKDAKEKIDKMRGEESTSMMNIDRLNAEIGSMISEEMLERKAQLIVAHWNSFFSCEVHYKEMSFDDKRKFLQETFSGKDVQGKRLGVYIKKMQSNKWPWLYYVHGNFPKFNGRLPAKLNLIDERQPGSGGQAPGYPTPHLPQAVEREVRFVGDQNYVMAETINGRKSLF